MSFIEITTEIDANHICYKCGEDLEVRTAFDTYKKFLKVEVTPCQTCLEEAFIEGESQ